MLWSSISHALIPPGLVTSCTSMPARAGRVAPSAIVKAASTNTAIAFNRERDSKSIAARGAAENAEIMDIIDFP